MTADHERQRQSRSVARAVRRSMEHIIQLRLNELPAGTPIRELWERAARHLPSCEYVKALENGLVGTLLGYPFSCRVAGCPYCESARIGQLRKRYWGQVREAVSPKSVTLTMRNVPAGELRRGWLAIGAAFARLRRSPLFHGGHCRVGKVGCLAGLVTGDRLQRRACGGRCVRRRGKGAGAACHVACRPCGGHQPVRAAVLALEATVGGDDASWHPHANLLFDGPFMRKRLLDAAWASALGADVAHTWIRDARKPPPGHRGKWTLEHALYETIKYAIKPDPQLIDSNRPRWFIEWVEARAGLRLVRSYGSWYGLGEPEPEADTEETLKIADPDTGRTYLAPVRDPLTDEPADWQVLPADQTRRRFSRFLPPGEGRRFWLIAHKAVRLEGDDQ